MDKLTHYRAILKRVIEKYASYKPSHGKIDTEAIVDPLRDHYEVMHIGWDGERRVHGAVIHLDLCNEKIWIQYDGTSWPVADALMAEGVPKEDIVLAFHPEKLRKYTGYAIK